MKRNLRSTLLGLFVFVSSLVVSTSASAFELHNLWSGDCLGVKAGNPNKGAAVIVWQCDGSANQNFLIVPASYNAAGEQTFYFYDGVALNRVLGVAGNASPGLNANVVTWTLDYSANQQWTMQFQIADFQSHPCYAIRSTGMLTEYGATSVDYYGEYNTPNLYGQRQWGMGALAMPVQNRGNSYYDPYSFPWQYWCKYDQTE